MNKIKKENRFYVYALLDPRKPEKYEYKDICFFYEPFYIGKGNENRCYGHFKKSSLKANSYKNNKIKKIIYMKLNVIIFKIKEDLLEEEAFKLERNIIFMIGRYDIKTGPLTNLNDGGNSGSGNILSEEAKLKIGENNAKYWKGKTHSKKTREKIKLALKRNPPNQKWRCRKYKVISPSGEEFIIDDGLEKFSNLHNLLRGKLVEVAKGRRNHHQKWKCKYMDEKPIYPKDKIYLLTSKNGKKYIVDNIIEFSFKYNLSSKRLYEVVRGKHCIHRGWKCELYNPN